MDETIEQPETISDALAEGVASIMAAAEQLEQPEDMADLFLEELNRLWAESPPLQAA